MSTQTSQLSENTPREMDFGRSAAINIGSHQDNDIVLKGAGVRPFHVSLVLQDGECQVLPLEADAEVRLDGKAVETASFKLAGAARRLDIGENTLLLEYNQVFDGLHVRINPATSPNAPTEGKLQGVAQVASAVSPAGESPILLNLFSQTDEVEAGQTAAYELEIVNAGALVASFNVFIEGVPQEWVSISPAEINLYEGQHKRVQIAITPPRQPDSTAGEHELRVSVFSANYPGHQAATPVFLRIKPYYEFMLDNLSPREQKVSWFKRLANTSLPITNRGNCPADFAVSAIDDENGCSFDFALADGRRLNRQAALPVPAGQTLPLPIEITPHKRRWINSKRYSYTTTVQVTNQPTAPQTVSGSLSSQPLFPWWSIMLALFTLAVALFIVLQPNIYYFQVAANKDVIELGDSTRLDWSVSFFTNRVSISNTTQPLNNGQTSLTVAPTQSTTYELTAGSWLSGLLNWDLRESRTVLVVPPSPTINAFAVDNTRVAQGKPTHIRWSITQADQAFLTVDDVVTELPKEQFSGEKDVVLTKDALVTLDAKNAGGHNLRSYFVNVVPPKITITTFTVWVKHLASKTGMSIKNGSGKLDAPAQASPDPNFPDKYVELVPDATSDNGYRVYFYQPDRELAKGEQVVVEWNVAGADNDKVQIAPFTDTLPAKGSQPFFPTESMNFVLTAKSGSLEAIYMLPVKVFNGDPPAAPKIEFFQAVPVSNVGPIPVVFSWSVSGNWTLVQLSNSKGIIAKALNSQGSMKLTVSESDTYILTAWNGALSSGKPVDIKIDPKLVPVKLEITSIYPNSDQFLVGNSILVTVTISGTGPNAKGKPFPTGTITVTDDVSTCSITLPALSCNLVFTTAGDKQLRASYSGDTIYSQGATQIKYPANKKIHVSSPTVKLTPDFYLTDAQGNRGSALADITSHQFGMDEKLDVVINITPLNAILPVDAKGHVTLTICNQDTGVCSDSIVAVVNVEKDGSFGTAEILIKNFPGAGTYSLRFGYRHDDNLLAPASYTQQDVHVLKMGIYLTLPPSCSDSIPDAATGATCSFSAGSKVAHIVFDIHRTVGKDYLDTSLPEPKYKTLIWQVYETGSKSNPLACIIDTRKQVDPSGSRLVYILDCPVNVFGKARLFINYDYANTIATDYFMGDTPSNFPTKSFILQPLGQTKIEFNRSDYSVGQVISLTNDLHLIDVNTNKQITKSTGAMTFSSNQAGLLDVVPGSTCRANTTGDAILDIAVDSVSVCQIFFRKVGTWDLQIDFSGDDNYAAKSASVAGIQVDQEALTTATWSYSGSPSNTTWENIAKITGSLSLTGKIVFVGNFASDSGKVFSNNAFDGVQLSLVPDSGNSVCTLNQPSAITYQTSSQQAVFNFVVTCQKRPAKVKLTLDFASSDQKNFGSIFATRQVLFADADNIGGVYFELTSAQKGYFNFDWQSANPSPKEIPLLYAGETYRLHLMYQPELIYNDSIKTGGCGGLCNTLDDVLDFIQYADKNSALYRKIDIKFPDSWAGRIASVSGSCSLDSAGTTITVPLSYRRNFQFTTWTGWSYVELSSPNMLNSTSYSFDDTTNPCIVSFGFWGEPNLPLGAGKLTNFSFSSYNTKTSFIEPTTGLEYSADESYVVDGLTKASVEATFNPSFTPKLPFNTKALIGSPAQTVTMTLSNHDTARVPLMDNILTNQFEMGYPSCMGLTGTITSNTTVTWTMTPATTFPCTGTLSIYYKENTYFGRQLLVSQPVQFTKPSATATPTPTPGP